MKLMQFALIAVLALGTVAWASHGTHPELDDVPLLAPEGTATIDGDLSEWAGDTWIPLDSGYGTGPFPADISNAAYAVRWDDANNKLIVAVTTEDSEQHLSDWFIDWNGQDDVEIYLDSGNHDVDYNNAIMDYAQQIFLGAQTVAGAWVFSGGGVALPPAIVAADGFAAQVNGGLLTYEIAITPYFYYTGGGGSALPESIVDLDVDVVIGLDVAVVSLFGGDPPPNLNFAVNSNTAPFISKWRMSMHLQSWKLVAGSGLQADFDGNGGVDLDDFVILKSNFGTGTTHAQGDANGDGNVDLDDFVILKNEFGS